MPKCVRIDREVRPWRFWVSSCKGGTNKSVRLHLADIFLPTMKLLGLSNKINRQMDLGFNENQHSS